MVYRIWVRGPQCPHCNDNMIDLHHLRFRCPNCHSLFEVDDEAMESNQLLGSGEIFCKEVYKGQEVDE